MDNITELKLHPTIKIQLLKKQLADSVYKALEYAEGLISEEEYAPIKAERQRIRDEINRLEKELKESEENI